MNKIVTDYYEKTIELDDELSKLVSLTGAFTDKNIDYPRELGYKLDETFAELSHRLEVLCDADLIEDYYDYRRKNGI